MTLKRSFQDLAIAGGPPAFAEPLHVGRPNLPDRARLHEALDAILDRRWLTNRGPVVQEFEAALAARLRVRHCIAVCNATVGLEVALRAVGATGEVIVPAFTFVATAHAVSWLGLQPVFCDVDPATHNIDPARVEALVTPRTSAIIGVHLWGRACDTAALAAIAGRRKLALIYDAAHGFSCASGGTMIGNFGDLEVFSFHATKFLNTFEGGAITTNSDALARTLRLMVNFGFAGYDLVVERGTNGKMQEMSAAVGLASLAQVETVIDVNRANHAAYRRELASLPGLELVGYDHLPRHNYQYVVVDVDEAAAGVSRDELVRLLWSEGVHARRYFHPGCARMAPYDRDQRWRDADLPGSDYLSGRLMTLPTGTAIGAGEVAAIASVLRIAAASPAVVRAALADSAVTGS